MLNNYSYIGGFGIGDISSQKTEKTTPKTNYSVNFADVLSQQLNVASTTSTNTTIATSPLSNNFSSVLNTSINTTSSATVTPSLSTSTNIATATSFSNTTSLFNESILQPNITTATPSISTSLLLNEAILQPSITTVTPATNTVIATSSLNTSLFSNVGGLTSSANENITNINLNYLNRFNTGTILLQPTLKLYNFNPSLALNTNILTHLANFNSGETTPETTPETAVRANDTVRSGESTSNRNNITNQANQPIQPKQFFSAIGRSLRAENGISKNVAETSAKASEKVERQIPAQNKPVAQETKRQEERPRYKLSLEPVWRDLSGKKVNLNDARDVLIKAFVAKFKAENDKGEAKDAKKTELTNIKLEDAKKISQKESLVNSKIKEVLRKLSEMNSHIASLSSTFSKKKTEEEREHKIEVTLKKDKEGEGLVKRVEKENEKEETGRFQQGLPR